MQDQDRDAFASDERRRQEAKPGDAVARPGDKDERTVEPPVGSPAREHALIKDGLRKRDGGPSSEVSPGAAADAEMARK